MANTISMDLIKTYAKKLSNKDFVENISLEKENYIKINGSNFYPYELISMSHGLPGLCFLYNDLSQLFPEEEWIYKMNDYIQEIMHDLQKSNLINPSLFSGYAGLGTLLTICSKDREYYSKYKESINIYLKELTQVFLKNINKNKDLVIASYDTMQGLAGILNYLMLTKENRDFFNTEIEKILKYFISLSKDKLIDEKKIPGWFITSNNLFLDEERYIYPDGVINLGLSHGISGPLVVMSTALNYGYFKDDLPKAIEFVGNILVDSMDKKHETWTSMLDVKYYNKNYEKDFECRDAWCYGRPGVAFALLKASIVLQNESFYDIAVSAMKASIQNEVGITSPTFCHGYAGVAYIFYKFYKMTDDKDFLNEANRLSKEIAAFHSENAPFGFQNIEFEDNNKMKYINGIGLLDGVSGIYLVLSSIMNDKEGEWDAMFLLN